MLECNGYWSAIIRVEAPRDTLSDLVRIDFSLPCNKLPQWVSTKPVRQRFRLIRAETCEPVLSGVALESHQDLTVPIWEYPPGIDHVMLPFGRILRCYRSLDLPLVPVL
jgi:hypothetical protein